MLYTDSECGLVILGGGTPSDLPQSHLPLLSAMERGTAMISAGSTVLAVPEFFPYFILLQARTDEVDESLEHLRNLWHGGCNGPRPIIRGYTFLPVRMQVLFLFDSDYMRSSD